MESVVEVHISVPDITVAESLTTALLQQKLAACVQIIGPVSSHYLWKSEVEVSSEHLLLIKTLESKYDSLEKLIREQHPYEVAEIIAVPVTHISPDYHHWIHGELRH